MNIINGRYRVFVHRPRLIAQESYYQPTMDCRRAVRSVTTAVFVALFVSSLTAQYPSEVRLGSVDVVRSDFNEVQIRRGGQIWRVDLSRIVRRNDCASLDEIGVETCPGGPTTPCPDCPRRVVFVAWDEQHRRLYFAVSTGTSKNNPWTIFSYSIVTRRIGRFTNTWAAGLGRGAVSHSGRYLAYVSVSHGGYCANSEAIQFLDLWDRRVAVLNGGLDTIKQIKWTSNTVLEFGGASQSEADRRDEKSAEPVRGSVNVAALSFR